MGVIWSTGYHYEPNVKDKVKKVVLECLWSTFQRPKALDKMTYAAMWKEQVGAEYLETARQLPMYIDVGNPLGHSTRGIIYRDEDFEDFEVTLSKSIAVDEIGDHRVASWWSEVFEKAPQIIDNQSENAQKVDLKILTKGYFFNMREGKSDDTEPSKVVSVWEYVPQFNQQFGGQPESLDFVAKRTDAKIVWCYLPIANDKAKTQLESKLKYL